MAAVYVETFLLQNTLVDCLLLYVAAIFRGGPIRPLRILVGGVLGGLFALIMALGGSMVRTLPFQGLVSLVMALVGLNANALRDAIKSACALWAGAILLGGAMALGLSLLIAGALTGITALAASRRKHAPPPQSVTLFIQKGNVTQTLTALVDTGARALTPLGLPVLFLPEGVFAGDPGRILYIRTAAGRKALPYFIPDGARVNGSPVRAAVALVPPGLLDGALVPYGLCAERTAS